MTTRKAGIVGAGYIAEFHIKAIRAAGNVQLTAICDNDRAKADTLQRRWGIPHAFSSLAEMLASPEVDVVHILLPPALHAAAVMQCLEAGRDVFAEKPLCCSAAEARGLLEACRRLGRVVGINHNNTCHPAFLQVVEAVKDWRLGRLESVTACLNVPLRQLGAGQHAHWMFRQPGNIVLEQGPHPLSQIILLMGPVQRVSILASGRVMLNTGTPFYDTWQCSLQCERGPAQLFMSFGREYMDAWIHAIGQDGAAHADLPRNTFQLTRKTRFLEPIDNYLNVSSGARTMGSQARTNFLNYALSFLKLRAASDPFSLGMHTSIAHFYEDLAAGRPPREGIEQGVAVVEACEAVIQAMEAGANG